MSNPGEPRKIDIQIKVREALGRATLARARNQREQALKLLQEAIGLDDADPEAYELKGDILLDLKRGEEAMACFKRARELHPDRPALEDKIARAALQRAARQRTIEMSQAILEGRVKPTSKKSPSYAALLSLLIPGLGQIYNGEMMKGLALILAFVFLFALAVLAVLREMAASPFGGMGYGQPTTSGAVMSALSSGSTVLVTILLAAVWIYAIAEAALYAGRTMTSDDTGLV
jgi:tetratricopeptide (TPR) repeat protein